MTTRQEPMKPVPPVPSIDRPAQANSTAILERRIKELELCVYEWLEKTDWVNHYKKFSFPVLGLHRADAMRCHIVALEAKVEELKSISDQNHYSLVCVMAGLKPGTELIDAPLVIKKLKADLAELMQLARDVASLPDPPYHEREAGLALQLMKQHAQAALAKHGGEHVPD